jgi:hypothetical protein
MMGRNVATYKFALAASLIELSSKGSDFIPLEDLAAPFSKNLCEHLKHSDKQITSPRSQFLDSCRKANQGEVSSQELIETTARLGFSNVIDAFHVVNQGDTPVRFFNDYRKTRGGITLMRGTLIRQTGDTDAGRHSFLNRSYQVAVDPLIHTWGSTEEFGTTV